MSALLVLAGKDLRLLVRDRLGFFFTFFFPLIYAIFFGVLFSGAASGPSAIGLLVVDEDNTPGSRRLIESLQSDRSFKVELVASRQAAAELVGRGARSAYLVIPPGFGAASERIFWGPPMRLELGLDPGKSMTGGLVQGLISYHAYQQMQRVFTDRQFLQRNARSARQSLQQADGLTGFQRAILDGLLANLELPGDPALFGDPTATTSQNGPSSSPEVQAAGQPGWQPVEIATTHVTRRAANRPSLPRSSFAICFPQAITWGVLACAATFAATLLLERTRGTLPRLTLAPLARWEILAGKALACFIATSGLMTILLTIARLAFGVGFNSVPLLAAGVLSISIAVVGLMMLLSVLGRSEWSVSGISWAIIIVMAMLGGGMLPLVFMPAWMQPLSSLSLVKWAVLAMEGAIWRGFSPLEMLLPCGILVGAGVAGFLIGASLFRISVQR